MEDASHPGNARMGREFWTQLVLEEAREPWEGHAEDDAPFLQGGGDDLRLGPSEQCRQVPGFRGNRSDAAPPQFRGDLEEHPLALDLLLDERRHEPKFLDPFDFDAGASFD